MRPATGILGILLGVSLLANVGLLVRAWWKSEPEKAASTLVERTRLSDETAVLKKELALERRKTEELRACVESLEAEKKLLIDDLSPSGPADRIARFREKIRGYVKDMIHPMPAAANVYDPQMDVNFHEGYMELQRIAAARAKDPYKDPQTYAEYSLALVELILEELKIPLSGDQAAQVERHFKQFGRSLAELPRTSAGDRLLKELELDAASMSKLAGMLHPEQWDKFRQYEHTFLTAASRRQWSVSAGKGDVSIAEVWTKVYQLGEAQQLAANAAARQYLAALKELEAPYKGRKGVLSGTGAEVYDYRIGSARAQIAALKLLEGALSPEQAERLRSQPMYEGSLVRPIDFSFYQEEVDEEK